jgi:hypothetical protein
MKKTISILSLVLALSFSAFGQATASSLLLTTTTLAAAVKTTSTTVLSLTSATGITAGNTLLYIEDGHGGNNEAVFVNSVNGTQVGVTRGYQGTQSNLHLAGAIVLAGPPTNFYSVDPSGACTAASTVTPYVNIMSSRQWICSSISGSFVPGYFNDEKNPAATTAVASVAGATNPSGPLFHVTGTNAITAWGSSTTAGLGSGGGSATQPFGAMFCIIPDAIFTTTATNNIALASTAVVSKLLCYTFDNTNKKYVPSY